MWAWLTVAVVVAVAGGQDGQGEVTGWLRVAASAAPPPWRYSHGAALLHPQCMVMTHGYNNRDPQTGLSRPDWRDDTWTLRPSITTTAEAGWRQLTPARDDRQPHGDAAVPTARYGHGWVRLGQVMVMYGGDSGGHSSAPGGGGGYVWGAFHDDVWLADATDACDASGHGATAASAPPGVKWEQVQGQRRVLPDLGPQNVVASPASPLLPPARSLHACIAVPLPLAGQGDGSDGGDAVIEVMLCSGGLIKRNGVQGGGVGAAALADSSDMWWMVLQESEAGVQARWRLWSEAGMGGEGGRGWDGTTPPPRNGHAMAYYPRLLLSSPAAGGGVVGVEHSVFLFGGTGSDCDPDALERVGYVPRLDFDAYVRNVTLPTRNGKYQGGGGGDGDAPPPLDAVDGDGTPAWVWAPAPLATCQYGDTWRLTWRTPPPAPLSTRGPPSQRYTGVLASGVDVVNGVVWPKGGKWERLEFAPHRRGRAATADTLLSSMSSWFEARGVHLPSWLSGTAATHPTPRSLPAMAVVHDGLVLFGGAMCSPGCTCHADTWRLYIQPTTVVGDGHGDGGEAGSHAMSLGMLWVAVTASGDGATLEVSVPRGEAPGTPGRMRGGGAASAPAATHATHPVRSDIITAAALQDAADDDPAAWLVTPALLSQGPSAWVPGGGGDHAIVEVTVGGWGGATPLERYRHTLASEYRYVHGHMMLAAAGAGATTTPTSLSAGPSLPAVAILFGGERYFPSTYFDDTWLFVTYKPPSPAPGSREGGAQAPAPPTRLPPPATITHDGGQPGGGAVRPSHAASAPPTAATQAAWSGSRAAVSNRITLRLMDRSYGALSAPTTLMAQVLMVLSVVAVFVCGIMGSRIRAWALRRHRAHAHTAAAGAMTRGGLGIHLAGLNPFGSGALAGHGGDDGGSDKRNV